VYCPTRVLCPNFHILHLQRRLRGLYHLPNLKLFKTHDTCLFDPFHLIIPWIHIYSLSRRDMKNSKGTSIIAVCTKVVFQVVPESSYISTTSASPYDFNIFWMYSSISIVKCNSCTEKIHDSNLPSETRNLGLCTPGVISWLKFAKIRLYIHRCKMLLKSA